MSSENIPLLGSHSHWVQFGYVVKSCRLHASMTGWVLWTGKHILFKESKSTESTWGKGFPEVTQADLAHGNGSWSFVKDVKLIYYRGSNSINDDCSMLIRNKHIFFLTKTLSYKLQKRKYKNLDCFFPDTGESNYVDHTFSSDTSAWFSRWKKLTVVLREPKDQIKCFQGNHIQPLSVMFESLALYSLILLSRIW